MTIEFRCEIEHARQWMGRDTLSVDGRDVPVQIAWTATSEPRPTGLDMLFELERLVLHKGKHSGTDRLKISPARMQARAGAADVIVDFTGGARDPNCSARQYLRPLFNGVAGGKETLAPPLPGARP